MIDTEETYTPEQLAKWARDEQDYKEMADWCQKYGFWVAVIGTLLFALLVWAVL